MPKALTRAAKEKATGTTKAGQSDKQSSWLHTWSTSYSKNKMF